MVKSLITNFLSSSSSSTLSPNETKKNLKLNYHLYTLPTPTTPGRKFFISDHIREDLLRRSEQVHTGSAAPGSLPEEVQGYHSLVPLEVDKKKVGTGGAGNGVGGGLGGGLGGGRTADGGGGMGGGWPSMSYKAIKSEDGGTYVLRRIESACLSLFFFLCSWFW